MLFGFTAAAFPTEYPQYMSTIPGSCRLINKADSAWNTSTEEVSAAYKCVYVQGRYTLFVYEIPKMPIGKKGKYCWLQIEQVIWKKRLAKLAEQIKE